MGLPSPVSPTSPVFNLSPTSPAPTEVGDEDMDGEVETAVVGAALAADPQHSPTPRVQAPQKLESAGTSGSMLPSGATLPKAAIAIFAVPSAAAAWEETRKHKRRRQVCQHTHSARRVAGALEHRLEFHW